MNRRIIIVLLLMAVCAGGTGCTPNYVREARQVLTEADSLRLKGVFMTSPDDSLRIAQAVETLQPWRFVYAADYAKACFHYGRTLRAKGHYPEAMQCFLNVIHSRSRDCIIKGRAYSNIGLMCRDEGNYELAFEMHVQAKNEFAKASDSTSFYYAINSMALQRAFQKDKEKVSELLYIIENECTYSAVLTKTFETRAIACRYVGEDDSALYYVSKLQAFGNREPTGYMIKAQAYSRLGIADSAIFYAKYIMENSPNMMDKYNALYILSNRDKNISNDSILKLTSQRADIGKEHTLRQESISHAVEILQQDLSKPYSWKWLYVCIGLLGCIGAIYGYRRFRAVKHHVEETKKFMRETIEQKCVSLSNLNTKQLEDTIYWRDYAALCHYIDANMNSIIYKLLHQYSTLSEQNIRLCILTMIGCSYRQQAEMLNIAKTSISKLKQIMAEKLGTDIKSLQSKLLDIASENNIKTES